VVRRRRNEEDVVLPQIQYKYVQIYTYTDLYIHICTFILSHFSLYQPTIHAHTCIYMQVQAHTY
jgi:hypothetical protein